MNALARRDEIADAVAERLRGDRQLVLSWWQRAVALMVAAAAVTDAVLRGLGF